jgi:uncharacterized membrane protein YhaH (DUF805 family)
LSKYVTFTGRAARSEYWYWILFVVIVSIVAAMIDAALGMGLVQTVVSLAFLLPGIAVSARRLHDMDHTGWWLLLGLTGIGNIVLLIWFCMKGTTGSNRFGPDPLP